MTIQIVILLAILFLTLVLFSFEWVSVDIVALGVLAALILTGLIEPQQAFAGFGSDTIIMILCLLILTSALVRTGVVTLVGDWLARQAGLSRSRVLIVVMVGAALLSSFISNTAATAFFVPIVMGLSQKLRVSSSRLLMPLAFASILASSVTLVGTSTNIVVSGLMTRYGMKPLGMFELTSIGLPIVLIGILYMSLIGNRLVPDRSHSDKLTEEFNLRPYLTDITILPGSPFTGKTLREIGMGRDFDLTVLRLTRGSETVMAPGADFRLLEGDILTVEGQAQDIYKIQTAKHLGVIGNPPLSDTDFQTDDFRLAEVLILPRSPLIGGTLLDMRLREEHQIQVLAINRHEETIHRKIAAIPLRMGDVLLVQGRSNELSALERNNTFRIMGTLDHRLPNMRRAGVATAIFAGSLLIASLGWLPVTVSLLVGVVLVFLTRCITPEEAYRDVEWKALILITGMLAFGTAMETTGTARFLADQIVRLFGHTQPVWLLSGFFLLTVALTQPMSNQAAAVVVLPVAIQSALQLDLNPRTFSVMIAVAASTSFITPLEPSCLLVYGLGRYRFMDFIKVGSLLTVFIFILAIVLVPMIWPF